MKKITYWSMVMLLLLNSKTVLGQNLVVNEVMTSNLNSIVDEDNSHEDWIELYNNGATPIGLLGHGLTDDAAAPYKWAFPQVTLNPGQYLLVWCSDKNRQIPGSPLHTNFKLSASGETIVLTNASGTTLQTVTVGSLQNDVSYGRFPNATGSFTYFLPGTPNAVNNSTQYSEVLNPPVFSQNSGFFTAGFSLSLSSSQSGTTIIYTLDGSEPDENNLSGTTYNYKRQYPELPGQAFGPLLQYSFTSNQYSSAIPIVDRSAQPNKISNISTTWDYLPPYIPNGPIFKGTVVKAKVIKPGALTSKTVTKNYFISPQGTNRFTIPVISISLDENDFYDYNDGISVAGVDFDTWRTANPTDEVNENLGNFNRSGDAYERMANLNYFVNGQEVINQKVGIRIHGDYSRQYPSKSMRVYARSSYGEDKLDYPLFSDQSYPAYERVVIKNAGSDFFSTMFRDALCNELVKDLHMETEASQQVVTFINGEYWGILALRERYDNNYFQLVYDIDAVDLLENEGEVKEGDDTDYTSFIDYFENNSLIPDANYTYIQTRMDTESFIDYFATNIYLENDDWPSNNIVYWRKKTAGYVPNASYGHDGRWRWAFHDVTSTFDDADRDVLDYATTTDPLVNDSPWSTLLLRKLLENNTFKIAFINRFADLMNTNFLASRINAKIDSMAAVIAPEMNDQYFRWKGPENDADWQYHLNQEKTFANQRAAYQRTHIRTKFGIASNLNATLDVSDEEHGYIKMNTIDIKDGTPGINGNPYPWTGVYFHNIPVTLKAIPLEGYEFSHWSGASTSTVDEITITPTANFSVTAHFIPAEPSGTAEVIYFWMMDNTLANNLPLTAINSTFEVSTNAVLQYQSCLAGYPFTSVHPSWRKASMERRNTPTTLNYIPSANNNVPYADAEMRGIQIKQPFQSGGLENTMLFNFSTSGYKDIHFAFAVLDEGAATGIVIDYATNAGTPVWKTDSMATSAFPINNTYQIIEADFTGIAPINNNPDFKVRIRFTGPNMMADTGERVTFNNFSVKGVPVSFTVNYTTPNIVTVNQAITSLNPVVVGGPATGYSIDPTLPSGLSINPSTGVISGTPSVVSPMTTYTVTASSSAGNTTANIVITVNDSAPNTLSYNSPNVFTKDIAITGLNASVSGGAVVNYSIDPALPSGLSLNPTSGVISGTPTVLSPMTTYTVTAANSGGNTTASVVITVNDSAPSTLSYNSPNVFTKDIAITGLNPSVSGGAVVNYSIDPALPSGLSINPTTGVISGTPTILSPMTTYTVTATNSGGNTTASVVITVNDSAPSTLSYNSPNVFTKDIAITNLNPTVSGGAVVNYSIDPALPIGLSINPSTGVISGTPTVLSPMTTYTVTATNSGGNKTASVVITVNDSAPNTLSYNSPNTFTKDLAITNLNPTVSGGAVVNYSIDPDLPSGLSINPSTGVISGTPTAVSPMTNYTVTATNSGGNTTATVAIQVEETLSGSQFAFGKISVYPNPFSDVIHIKGYSGTIAYTIYTIDGKLIKTGIHTADPIQVTELPSGLFLLKLEAQGKQLIKKIIK